jgi:quinol monooxygenase YgiN
MYGLIGRILAQPGKRRELAEILVPGEGGMPGCLSYIVAEDPEVPDALWVTEVWESRDAHRASLQLPRCRLRLPRARR